MSQPETAPEVCIVGGAGHIGAPLGILLADRGLRTVLYDRNADALAVLAGGRLPFREDGGLAILRRALASGRLGFTTSPAAVAGAPHVVITIGTPIDEFHNPSLRVLTDCLDTLLPYLADDQTLVLRSTVFPGVTDYLDRYLKSRGRQTRVAFCPERVVQGNTFREIVGLPQIISGTSPQAVEEAARLFGRIAPTLVRMIPAEAELAKLICNAYRYIQFAATNQFYMMAEAAGLDYARVLDGVKQGYPRAHALPGPGFAAGPCLMKDTMQLFAFSNSQFLLGQMAMIANEGLPNFVVERLRRSRDLTRTRVGILGMAFKADIDDARESLSYKLGKILRFHGAQVVYSDEHVQGPTFVSKEALLASSDVVIVGVPHAAYRGLKAPPGVEVIDLWQVLDTTAAEGRLRLAS
jgi:UDP-N-acetyl-D-mannosaminuronic acid dehydrogenase